MPNKRRTKFQRLLRFLPLSSKTIWIYILVHAVLFLLGLIVARHSSAIWQGVGSSLMAAGIAGWVILLYVQLSEITTGRLDMLRRFGFISAFSARSIAIREEYEHRLDAASEEICVMGFGLRALREDFHREFERWSAKAKVRILLLDPEFPTPQHSFANQRDAEEGDVSGSIAGQVKEFVRIAAPTIRNSNGMFRIRLYRCLPSINLFRIDDQAFWGPYLVRERSRNQPTFLVERGGILFDVVTAHFDAIWSDEQLSRDVPQDWLEVVA